MTCKRKGSQGKAGHSYDVCLHAPFDVHGASCEASGVELDTTSAGLSYVRSIESSERLA